MRTLQLKSDYDSVQYQSLTYTDGIYLQNIGGDQLKLVIDYLTYLDNSETNEEMVMPTNIESQIELFETAEYLGLDELKVLVVKEGLLK